LSRGMLIKVGKRQIASLIREKDTLNEIDPTADPGKGKLATF
jgi:hypothetical protein